MPNRRQSFLVWAGIVATTAASAAPLSPDSSEISRYISGKTIGLSGGATFQFNADKTFTGHEGERTKSGTYLIRDGAVCLVYSGYQRPYCAAILRDGATWTWSSTRYSNSAMAVVGGALASSDFIPLGGADLLRELTTGFIDIEQNHYFFGPDYKFIFAASNGTIRRSTYQVGDNKICWTRKWDSQCATFGKRAGSFVMQMNGNEYKISRSGFSVPEEKEADADATKLIVPGTKIIFRRASIEIREGMRYTTSYNVIGSYSISGKNVTFLRRMTGYAIPEKYTLVSRGQKYYLKSLDGDADGVVVSP